MRRLGYLKSMHGHETGSLFGGTGFVLFGNETGRAMEAGICNGRKVRTG